MDMHRQEAPNSPKHRKFKNRSSPVVPAMLAILATACIALAAPGDRAVVEGYCYLAGETLHGHTKVQVDQSVLHPPVFIDCDGHYGWVGILLGEHRFDYAHVGYWPETHIFPVGPLYTMLPDVVLESKAICGPLAYPYTIPQAGFTFPYEERVHHPTSVYRIEWWYANFHLTDEDGREYGAFAAFFKPPVLGAPSLALIWVIDLEYGIIYSDAKIQELFTAHDQYLDVAAGLPPCDRFYNKMCGGQLMPFEYHLFASGLDNGIVSLDVDMKALKDPIAIGGDGLVEFGSAGWSYYYTHPRVDVLGRLHLPGFPLLGKEVQGTAWIDHQWADFPNQIISWEWISIQLDDDREIMVANVWGDDQPLGSFSGGLNYYDEDCTLEILEDYSMTVLDSWTDPVTGREFATRWRVTEPARQIDLTVTAMYDHQIMRIGQNQIFPFCFWEGVCTVEGTIDGQPVTGRAFAEATHTPPDVPPGCIGDVNGDGVVDVLDLLALLAAWGDAGGPEDTNGDGVVDVLDLLELLAHWGPCLSPSGG